MVEKSLQPFMTDLQHQVRVELDVVLVRLVSRRFVGKRCGPFELLKQLDTPPKSNMEPEKWLFPTGICFFRGPFLGSTFVFGGVLSKSKQAVDFWGGAKFWEWQDNHDIPHEFWVRNSKSSSFYYPVVKWIPSTWLMSYVFPQVVAVWL